MCFWANKVAKSALKNLKLPKSLKIKAKSQLDKITI